MIKTTTLVRSLDLLWTLGSSSDFGLAHLLCVLLPQHPLLLKLDMSQIWQHLLSIQIFTDTGFSKLITENYFSDSISHLPVTLLSIF